MPWLDNWLAKNPVFRIGPPSFDRAAGLCYQMLVERKAEKDRSGAQRDFLDDILEIDDQNFGLIIGRMFINVRMHCIKRSGSIMLNDSTGRRGSRHHRYPSQSSSLLLTQESTNCQEAAARAG